MVVSSRRWPVGSTLGVGGGGASQILPRMIGQGQAMRLLLTGYSDYADILGSVNDCEVFRFINKPWDNQQLLDTVNFAASELPSGEISSGTAGRTISVYSVDTAGNTSATVTLGPRSSFLRMKANSTSTRGAMKWLCGMSSTWPGMQV